MKLSEIIDDLSASLLGNDAEFESISTDSRAIQPGDLFIALSGDRFDAHDYLDQVAEKGACGAIVSRKVDAAIPQLLVTDTLKALGQLGSYMVKQQPARLVALTGSCGKTTTKEMIRQALSSAGNVYATRGNLNNHIGVPITLSEVTHEHDFAVIEMGASGVGEIQYTVSMTEPEVVLLTNASEAHVEGFGSLENIVQAKGEIVRYSPEHCRVVLNADDPHFEDWVAMAESREVISFSANPESKATVRLQSKNVLAGLGYALDVDVAGQTVSCQLNVAGEHMIQNALATLAVVYALKVDVAEAALQLNQFEAVKGRFFPIQKTDYTVWDDTYNANPESVKAAIKTIAEYQKPCWLVLGNMAELGEHAEQAHAEIGRFAEEKGFSKVFAIGVNASSVVGEHKSGTAYKKDDMDVLISDLRSALEQAEPELQILVKGSRSAGMENVVSALVDSDS